MQWQLRGEHERPAGASLLLYYRVVQRVGSLRACVPSPVTGTGTAAAGCSSSYGHAGAMELQRSVHPVQRAKREEMGGKRKASATEGVAPEAKKPAAAQEEDAGPSGRDTFRNKEKVLILSSRGITHRCVR